MQVTLLASTTIAAHVLAEAYDDYDVWGPDAKRNKWSVTNADALAEAAGRLCYKSFHRPNEATAGNRDYLANIIRQGHFSILEHSSATFLVQGVSRALLTELTRHRHLSFSVVSQRYVSYENTGPVIPPALCDDLYATETVRVAYAEALEAYTDLVSYLMEDRGLKRKEAREAARCVLPNAAPVDMVVTGNLRAWRDVLGKRWHIAADAEIREFAGKTLEHLRTLAPNSFQDIPAEPYGT
jgi:thymidylate synthase (FAD)